METQTTQYKNTKIPYLVRPTAFETSALCLHSIFGILVCTNHL